MGFKPTKKMAIIGAATALSVPAFVDASAESAHLGTQPGWYGHATTATEQFENWAFPGVMGTYQTVATNSLDQPMKHTLIARTCDVVGAKHNTVVGKACGYGFTIAGVPGLALNMFTGVPVYAASRIKHYYDVKPSFI